MSPPFPPARSAFAVDLLDPRPGEQVLEVGCGPGVAAALVATRIGDDGRLVAIDRSPTAIERTRRRTADEAAAGIVELHVCELAMLERALGASPAGAALSFDKAFAVNVNLFWVRDATTELDLLARLLRPGGLLLLVYEAPGDAPPARAVETVAAALAAHGFADVAVTHGDGASAIAGRTV